MTLSDDELKRLVRATEIRSLNDDEISQMLDEIPAERMPLQEAEALAKKVIDRVKAEEK